MNTILNYAIKHDMDRVEVEGRAINIFGIAHETVNEMTNGELARLFVDAWLGPEEIKDDLVRYFDLNAIVAEELQFSNLLALYIDACMKWTIIETKKLSKWGIIS